MTTGFFNGPNGKTIIKDPDAKLDYTLDWSQWLGTDTIVNSTWNVDAGLTVETESNTSTTTVVWLSGGNIGKTYIVNNHIVTVAGREEDRSFVIKGEGR